MIKTRFEIANEKASKRFMKRLLSKSSEPQKQILKDITNDKFGPIGGSSHSLRKT